MTFNGPEERLHAPQVQLPHQLPDDVGRDGEDREIPLKPLPPPEGRVLQPKGLDVPVELLDPLPHPPGLLDLLLAEREVGRVEALHV